MSPTIGLPPPLANDILDQSRRSRYRGGTLIAEEVCELSEHLSRMANADQYRPCECARCGHRLLHVHDRVERHPIGDGSLPPTVFVLVFRCALTTCGATWRILPRFLARHLWYAWRGVEQTVRPDADAPLDAASAAEVSQSTQRRWQSRLASSGRTLAVLLAMAGGPLEELAAQVSLTCTRGALLDAFIQHVSPPPGMQLSAMAAVVHRLERGIRLM